MSRIKDSTNFWNAAVVLAVGVATRAYAGIRAGAPIDLSSFLPLVIVTLPYAILATVALLIRSGAARFALVVSVTILLAWDIHSFSEWVARSKEAAVGRAIIWMHAMVLSVSLAGMTGFVALIARGLRKQPNQSLEPTATAVTDRAAHAPRQP